MSEVNLDTMLAEEKKYEEFIPIPKFRGPTWPVEFRLARVNGNSILRSIIIANEKTGYKNLNHIDEALTKKYCPDEYNKYKGGM